MGGASFQTASMAGFPHPKHEPSPYIPLSLPPPLACATAPLNAIQAQSSKTSILGPYIAQPHKMNDTDCQTDPSAWPGSDPKERCPAAPPSPSLPQQLRIEKTTSPSEMFNGTVLRNALAPAEVRSSQIGCRRSNPAPPPDPWPRKPHLPSTGPARI